MASMQSSRASMLLEGIASAPGRHSMSRILPQASSAACGSSSRGTAVAPSAVAVAALSPTAAVRGVNAVPSTAGASSSTVGRRDVAGNRIIARRAEEAEPSPAPPSEPLVVKNSPPLVRYVVKGDSCVEQKEDTLQPVTVPALVAAAMAAVKEAAGRDAYLRNRAALQGEGFGSHAAAPLAERGSVPNGQRHF
ncbi:unnamed protein product [Polarella glacialis]|uniref:Uncharacterized protein n=1 Tax=Polarella glacialis TaxID=89957 RepID=A0A813KBF7_POLGL|nr:unnamed protein product [Polarella glacialis]